MPVDFEAVPYKALHGYYVRVTWPDGRSLNIDDHSTSGPVFASEAEAELWISTQSDRWLRRRRIPN